MKQVYMYDTAGLFTGFKTVADDYQLTTGETVVAIPQPNAMPIKWTGSAWQNATDEEAAAYQKQLTAGHPAPPMAPAQPTTPTPANQATNTLGQQLAQVMQQQTLIMNALNALGQQRAAQDTTKQGA